MCWQVVKWSNTKSAFTNTAKVLKKINQTEVPGKLEKTLPNTPEYTHSFGAHVHFFYSMSCKSFRNVTESQDHPKRDLQRVCAEKLRICKAFVQLLTYVFAEKKYQLYIF